MPQVAPMQFFDHQRQPRVVGCRKSSRNGCIAKAGYNDFRPAWGVDAELAFVATGDEPSAEPRWLTILDDSGQAGALGYHNLHPTDCRSEKIFAGTDLKCGSNWTVTAGHELLEMLADPNINLNCHVQTSDETAGRLYANEVCDACEDDSFRYKIGDVNVPDSVFASRFEDFRSQGSTQFDQTRKINRPSNLLKGGYIGVFDINSGSGWHRINAEKHSVSLQSRGNVGSRRERRATPYYEWMPSLTHREIVSRAKSYPAPAAYRRTQTGSLAKNCGHGISLISLRISDSRGFASIRGPAHYMPSFFTSSL